MLSPAMTCARSCGQSNRTMRRGSCILLSALFRWAEEEELVAANPMFKKKWPACRPRTRNLKDEETKWVLLACAAVRVDGRAAGRWASVVETLLRLGQRESDVKLLTDSELDLNQGLLTLPPERHKGGREHVLPLPSQVVDILCSVDRPDGSGRVFQRLGKKEDGLNAVRAKAEQLAGKPIPHWTLHDLRRTLDTQLRDAEEEDRDVADHATIESILGHSLRGVSRHYNFSKLLRKKRRALTWWNAHLDALLKERVVAIAA